MYTYSGMLGFFTSPLCWTCADFSDNSLFTERSFSITFIQETYEALKTRNFSDTIGKQNYRWKTSREVSPKHKKGNTLSKIA